ncbi:M23 family metallopeptidase [Corynebacterium glutamicum]|uniref:M23 family metallopeptidase n=1 Tax=Corynebacterium glutamicum TaxID=1718 RepID=UPI0024188A71|nr:M23 family metallopeptidase [Corynebacterium glutamicum]WFP72266.1 M23 family metallopeptidase [Corynebacterium glutamicum]
MLLKAQRSAGGKHRKIPTSQTKSRVALVAVATGAVSSAGIGGAAAATLQTQAEASISPQDTVGGVQLATNDTALPPDTTETAPQILTISEYKPVTNINEQLDKAVEYAAERTEAARAEAARLEAERIEAERLANASSVVKPTEGTFTSGFGMRWGSLHAELDIANVVGTPILAAMGGTVIDSGPASGFGQWIRIQHDDGSIAVYGHMETLDVSVGEQVTAGQKIAGMGNRGFSTGSHLHFELYPTGSGAVDPAPWFAQHGITF